MALLLIPAAGASTRFNFNRPKFLLQHPLGGSMLENSIVGLGDLKNQGIEKILVVSLASYFEDVSAEKFIKSLKDRFLIPTELLLLDNPTTSMVDTVVKGIEFIDQEEAIIVKDCDNFVGLKEGSLNLDFNLISTVDISIFNNIRPDNKSYLSINENGMLLNIVEKKIISSNINIGCVKFASSPSPSLFNLTTERFCSTILSFLV
jgi:bifunctional N-acetylglucosamine-1-phosphate-uridyltransferase/glucosamine-1-phosphate-acetyltransferase GlmU-like protein